MGSEQSDDKKKKSNNEDAAVKPDAGTLNTTDPQDHMEGPISSLAKGTVEGIEDEEGAKKESEDSDQ